MFGLKHNKAETVLRPADYSSQNSAFLIKYLSLHGCLLFSGRHIFQKHSFIVGSLCPLTVLLFAMVSCISGFLPANFVVDQGPEGPDLDGLLT